MAISRTTKKKTKKRKKKRPGAWIDDIMASVGHFVSLETRDGISREGTISGMRTLQVEFNGSMRELPVSLELNGDNYDTIDLITIQRLTVDKLKS